MAVCVQDAVDKNKFLVKFEYGNNRDISASSLPYLCDKEEVGQEVDDIIYDLPKIVKGKLWTINGDPVFEWGGIFEKGMYLSIFIVLVLFKRYHWIY